jgi:chromosome segregation ATPase
MPDLDEIDPAWTSPAITAARIEIERLRTRCEEAEYVTRQQAAQNRQLRDELGLTEGDLTVAVHEAQRARAVLRSADATNAELRRQLAGTNALLATAEAEAKQYRDRALTAEAERDELNALASDLGEQLTGRAVMAAELAQIKVQQRAVLDLHAPVYKVPGLEPECAGCATNNTFTPWSKCRTRAALGAVSP